MSEIFVTGHRNPDTDSIVAAISYAALRRSLGERDYRAVRLGTVNDETQRMLERFGFEAPEYVHNLRAQVKDLEIDRPPVLLDSDTNEFAWTSMNESGYSTLPVSDADGRLFGILSKADIAEFDMRTIEHNHVEDLPVFNLLRSLEGHLVNEDNFISPTLSGTVVIAIESDNGLIIELNTRSIVICAGNTKTIEAAVAAKAACIIVCQSDIKPEWSQICGETCVISTHFSGRAVARKIFEAIPCSRICITRDLISFGLEEYVDDVKERMLETKYRCYPVVDGEGKVVGVISGHHMLRPKRKQVVLVDHNEASQSVPFLDQVEILEIIDHHRLADIQTGQPILVRNEPVGATTTIIASMFSERGIVPDPALAGLMASAILSDTILFKSPTCTKRDVSVAERLCRIAGVTAEELGRQLFSSAHDENRSVEDLFNADYKQFNISGQKLGIGQLTCDSTEWFDRRRDEFMDYMEKKKAATGLDMVMLMITDLLREGSHIYYCGKDELITQAFNVTPENNYFFLPGVMSRKKQIVPLITAIWG